MGKGLFDKNKEDDRYFNQHEHATLMEGRIPGSWMVSLNIYFSSLSGKYILVQTK